MKTQTENSARLANHRSLFRRTVDFLYGYDFFISYSRQHDEGLPSGESYAALLTSRLESHGFKCFLDRKDFAAGDAYKGVGERKLRMTGQLVVVATSKALEAPAVIREVQIFGHKGSSRIIPIDFGGTIRLRDDSKPIFKDIAEDVLFIEESVDCLMTGPSDETVARLRLGFDLTRQDSKRVRFFSGAALVFLLVSLLAMTAGIIAQKNAVLAKDNEMKAIKNAGLAKANQLQAEQNAKEAAANANEATKNASSAKRNLVQAYSIQGSEMIGQNLHSEATAYLGAALQSAEPGDSRKDVIKASLASLLASGRLTPLVAKLEHPGNVTGARFSRTGKFLLTTSAEKNLRLWNFLNGEPRQIGEPIPHTDPLDERVAFSQDETRLAVADGTGIKIFDTPDLKAVREPIILAFTPGWLAFTRDGRFLLASSSNKGKTAGSEDEEPITTIVIEVATAKQYLISDKLPLREVSPLGAYAIIGEKIMPLVPPFKKMSDLPSELGPTSNLIVRFYSSDELAFVCSGSESYVLMTSKVLRIPCVENEGGNPFGVFGQRLESDFSVASSGKSGFLISDMVDGEGEKTGQILAAFDAPESNDEDPEQKTVGITGHRELENTSVQLSPSGSIFACLAGRGTVQIRDTDSNEIISNGIRNLNPVEKMVFSPDERFIATMASDRFLYLWRIDLLRKSSKSAEIHPPDDSDRWLPNFLYLDGFDQSAYDEKGEVFSAHGSPGKTTLKFHEFDQTAEDSDQSARKESLLEFTDAAGKVAFARPMEKASFASMGFANAGNFFHLSFSVAGTTSTTVGDSANGKILYVTPGTFLGTDPAQKWIICGSEDKVDIVEAATGKTLPFSPVVTGVAAVCASIDADHRYLACGFAGETESSPAWAAVWDLKTGERIMTCDHGSGWEQKYLTSRYDFAGGIQSVKCVAFGPDSRLATFSAADDINQESPYNGFQPRRARIWDIATGSPCGDWMQVNPHHTFGPDGKEKLKMPLAEEMNYLREVSIRFSATGRELQFLSGSRLFQSWNINPAITQQDLIEAAEVLSGFHYDSASARLIPLPDTERIARWRNLAGNHDIAKILHFAKM